MSSNSPSTPASALRTAAYHGHLTIVLNLIEEAVDLNVPDQRGRTALSLAAGAGHLDVVEALLKAGAWVDPHEDYDTYETPLIAAAANGHLRVVQALLSAGANPHHYGGVPQAKAEFYARCNGHSEVAAYLRRVVDQS